MTGAWTHLVCTGCWNAMNPDRPASGPGSERIGLCCFCDAWTNSGIFLRRDPALCPRVQSGTGEHAAPPTLAGDP